MNDTIVSSEKLHKLRTLVHKLYDNSLDIRSRASLNLDVGESPVSIEFYNLLNSLALQAKEINDTVSELTGK